MSGKNFVDSRRRRLAALVFGLLCSLGGWGGWGGLCPAALANTTIAADMAAATAAEAVPATVYSVTRGDSLESQMPETGAAPAAVRSGQSLSPRLRMALLLPLRSSTLKAAAEMVRDGFRAAHLRDGAAIDVDVVDTDDSVAGIVSAYRSAAASHDVIVGPLSRSAVGALASSGVVDRPTIALAQPEASAGADGSSSLPPHMLAIGLSIEDEARQAAGWAAREQGSGRALIVSTGVAWQKRAARAFIGRWQSGGARVDVMELSVSGNALNGAALTQLKKRLQTDPPAFVFVALDTAQTRQLRAAVDPGLTLYGTSQLNSLNLAEIVGAEKHPELDGVRLLDLPWQLQADHPAVMAYPRAAVTGAVRRSADLERLYALGIDAFRVAAEIGAGRERFTLDGVTGRLTVQFDGIAPATFERVEQQAIYTDGMVLPVTTGP